MEQVDCKEQKETRVSSHSKRGGGTSIHTDTLNQSSYFTLPFTALRKACLRNSHSYPKWYKGKRTEVTVPTCFYLGESFIHDLSPTVSSQG